MERLNGERMQDTRMLQCRIMFWRSTWKLQINQRMKFREYPFMETKWRDAGTMMDWVWWKIPHTQKAIKSHKLQCDAKAHMKHSTIYNLSTWDGRNMKFNASMNSGICMSVVPRGNIERVSQRGPVYEGSLRWGLSIGQASSAGRGMKT